MTSHETLAFRLMSIFVGKRVSLTSAIPKFWHVLRGRPQERRTQVFRGNDHSTFPQVDHYSILCLLAIAPVTAPATTPTHIQRAIECVFAPIATPTPIPTVIQTPILSPFIRVSRASFENREL